MTKYLIEFRFFGSAKGKIQGLIWEIDRKFRLGSAKKRRPVPHISLCGPLITNSQKRLISDFKRICNSKGLMQFIVKGFSSFDYSNVVYFNIKASKQLDAFRWELSKKIRKYSKLNSFDYKRKFYFHSTVAMKLSDNKFKAIKNYIKNKPQPNYKHTMIRATLLKYGKQGSRILYEYDFVQRRLLNRQQAKSGNILSRTFSMLSKKLNKNQKFESPNLYPYYIKKTVIITVIILILWYLIKNFV